MAIDSLRLDFFIFLFFFFVLWKACKAAHAENVLLTVKSV